MSISNGSFSNVNNSKTHSNEHFSVLAPLSPVFWHYAFCLQRKPPTAILLILNFGDCGPPLDIGHGVRPEVVTFREILAL